MRAQLAPKTPEAVSEAPSVAAIIGIRTQSDVRLYVSCQPPLGYPDRNLHPRPEGQLLEDLAHVAGNGRPAKIKSSTRIELTNWGAELESVIPNPNRVCGGLWAASRLNARATYI